MLAQILVPCWPVPPHCTLLSVLFWLAVQTPRSACWRAAARAGGSAASCRPRRTCAHISFSALLLALCLLQP